MLSLKDREKRTNLVASKLSDSDMKKLGFLFTKYKLFNADATMSNMIRRLILRVYVKEKSIKKDSE